MVAAWISAETGVGPSMASSSQDCSGNCADLPHAPRSSRSPMATSQSFDAPSAAGKTTANAVEPKTTNHRHDRERHAEVADPVDDERLLWPQPPPRVLVLPEPDEQVRRQAHALPAHVEDQVVVGQHQEQHRRDEQVEVAEEPLPVLVVLHVADRVDVDERADAGDEQDERHRELVEQQPDRDVVAAHREAVPQRHGEGTLVLTPGRASR